MAGSHFRCHSKTYAEPGFQRKDSFWEEMSMNGRGDFIRKPQHFENFHHEGLRFRASQSEGSRSAIAPDAHATYLASWEINRVTGSKISHQGGWYVRHMAKWHVTQLSGMPSTHMTHCHFRPFSGWPVKYITRWDVTHTSRTEGTRLSGWKHSTERPIHSSGDSGYHSSKFKPYRISNDDSLCYPNTLHSRSRPGPKETPWTSRFYTPPITNSVASTPVSIAWSSRYHVSNPPSFNSSFSSTPLEPTWSSRYNVNLPPRSNFTTSAHENVMTSKYKKNMSSAINSSYASTTPTDHAWSSRYNINLTSSSDASFPPSPNDKVWTPRYNSRLQPSVNNSYTSHQGINTNFQCSANSHSYERLYVPRMDRPDDETFDHSLNDQQEKSYRSAETTAMQWKENEQRKAWVAELEALMKKYNAEKSPVKHTSADEDIATRNLEKKVTYKSSDDASSARNEEDANTLKSGDAKNSARKDSGNRRSKSAETSDKLSQSVKTETCRPKKVAKSHTKNVTEKRSDSCAVLEELIRKYNGGSIQGSSQLKTGDSDVFSNSSNIKAAEVDDKMRKPEKRVTYSPTEPKTHTWNDSVHAEKKASCKSAGDTINKSFRPEKYRSRQTWNYTDKNAGRTVEGEDVTGNCDQKVQDRAKSADSYDVKKKSEKKVTYNLSEQKPGYSREGESKPAHRSFLDEIMKKYEARYRHYRHTEPLVFLKNKDEKRSCNSAEVESLLRKYGAGRSSSSTDVNHLIRKYDGSGSLRSSDIMVYRADDSSSTIRSSDPMALTLKSAINKTWGDGTSFSCSSKDPLSLTKRDDLSVSKVPKSWSYDFRVLPVEVRTALWRDALSSTWRTGMSGSWRNAFMYSLERSPSVFSDEQYRTWQENISITLSAVYSMGFRLTRAYVTHQLESNLRPSSSMD